MSEDAAKNRKRGPAAKAATEAKPAAAVKAGREPIASPPSLSRTRERAGVRVPGQGQIRAVIEKITPQVDAGRFAAKRCVGDTVIVEADCFADGHDVVACTLLYKREGAADWNRASMTALGNDRWRGAFIADALGAWRYSVMAWVDPFLSWRHDFERRVDADDIVIAARAGAALIAEAARRAPAGDDRKQIAAWADDLARAATARGGADTVALKTLGLAEAQAAIATKYPDLTHATTYPQELPLWVDRERARCSAWYELFPRSTSDDPARHGTFADVEKRLPYVAKLGFDVLYLPPIHPIGRARRKGRNNTLDPKPDDLGSPWAIGSDEGGHQSILPALGTLDDFRHLVAAARGHGIEVALDVAFQCAPDHPWVREHPEWFRKRADGSIQYAENPPKKYQDIVPFDFETAAWRELWDALVGVFEYWIGEGVSIFRVDNPHTKAFAFWEWAIARLRAAHPEVLLLSEAFTRPKVMHRLAKLGFTQSYTYFAWRNTKHELTEYFTELSAGPGVDYFRPNVWPNTPDILTEQLQQGGRPMFIARVTLAATLAANYGIYGPAFELLEHVPIRAGSEEYLDSEKYQRRVWQLDRDDSLADIIALLNHARRDNPALRRNESLRFLAIDNDQLIAWCKSTPGLDNVVVTVVNLDSRHAQSGWLEMGDLASLGIDSDRPYRMHDLLSGARFAWSGARNFVMLDSQRMPAHVMVIEQGA